MRLRSALLLSLSVLLVVNLGCGGGTNATTQSTTNPVPALTTLTPATATAGAPDTSIAAEGTGFVAGTTLDWNGTGLATTYGSPTQLTAKVPAALLANGTTGKVTAVSPSPGGGTSAAVSFVVDNPTPVLATSVPGSTVAGGSDLTLNLAGSGFVPSSTVTLNGSALATTFVSATALTATLPAADQAMGAVAVLAVANPAPAGGLSGAVSFTVNNPIPSVLSVNPASLTTGAAATQLSITGTGFVPSSTISWNGAALATTFVSSTLVQAVLPPVDAATATVGSLTAANPAPLGGVSAPLSFAVDNALPVIASVSPTSVSAGASATTLTIVGTQFVPTSVVDWNGAPLATTYVSPTTLTALVPAADLSAGLASMLTINNPAPGGGTSAALTFDVDSPTPVVSSLTPLFVPSAKAATITVVGTGFESTSTALWDGAARPTVVVGDTMLQVMLSAADLQQDGTGAISVVNPGPGGTTSSAATLTATSQPIPSISAASVVLSSQLAGCPQLMVTLTGSNFTGDSIISVNGTALQNIDYLGQPSSIFNFLPAGFFSKVGALSFTVTNPGNPSISSVAFNYPSTSPTVLSICAMPSPATVYDASSFTVLVQPTEVNATGTATLSLGTLPSGLTTTSNSVPMPATGAVLHFQVAPAAPAGSYTVALHGTAGAVTDNEALALTVSASAPPGFYFTQSMPGEVGVAFGGSGSTQFTSQGYSFPSPLYDITPSISGLPAGTIASFSPSVFSPGQTVTVTVTAASNAPVTQNASVTLTGTPLAAAAAATGSFFLDVTQPPGSLPDSRTDFTSTAGTPYAAVFDSSHQLIFSSNPAWNRVDVLSSVTHLLVKSIPVLSPQGIDITPDNSRVWVGTKSRQVFAIDTSALTKTRYTLPLYQSQTWADFQLEALSDGTVLLSLSPGLNSGEEDVAVWNPATNLLTPVNLPSGAQPGLGWGLLLRSGDATKVYSYGVDSVNCQVFLYDVATHAVATPALLNEACGVYAVNHDGSRIVGSNGAAVILYDQSFNPLGTIIPGDPATYGYFEGSFIFSQAGGSLYEISQGRISTYDTASLSLLGVAPAISTVPLNVSETPFQSNPFAVDPNQILLGIQTFGIAFEDTSFFQHYGAFTAVGQDPVSLSPYSGPLSGGTAISPYGSFDLTPDVWFGGTRATSVTNQSQLIITSPPSTVAGPVNLKYLFPNGTQIFSPQVFSYSVYPQYAVLSGSPPEGGVPGRITGYGMPTDASGGTLTVGGNSATITTTATQYPPFTSEPFPTTNLDFTFPAGTPGWADLSLTTPSGSGTLPKSLFYAKSVTDYPSTDRFTSVLFDAARNQVYLTAGDHVDVFSTASNQFVTALHPAAAGSVKQFTGLAMTPDNSQLLVTDLADGSLAVINPDSPSSTYSIAITPEYSPYNNCVDGPLYVAATSNQLAFVTTGSLPAPSCPSSGFLYVANLQSRTAAQPYSSPCQLIPPYSSGSSVAASADGNTLAINGSNFTFGSGACIYSAQSGTYAPVAFSGISLEISGDANVFAAGTQLADSTATFLGSLAEPLAFYPTSGLQTSATIALQRPRLNASGSLQYTAFPDYLEIEDVWHARLFMRFSLGETVQNTASPIAIDAGGRFIYLITTQGLTVIDMGAAPLAIGHLSPPIAAAGASIIVRGSGFDSSIHATVGGQSATVTVTDQNTLTLTLPSAPSGPEDIMLTRSDGGSYTLESGVTIQ